MSNSTENMKKQQSSYFHLEDNSHKHVRFSVIQWLGTKIHPDTQDRHRVKGLESIWHVPTINPNGINQFVK